MLIVQKDKRDMSWWLIADDSIFITKLIKGKMFVQLLTPPRRQMAAAGVMEDKINQKLKVWNEFGIT